MHLFLHEQISARKTKVIEPNTKQALSCFASYTPKIQSNYLVIHPTDSKEDKGVENENTTWAPPHLQRGDNKLGIQMPFTA